MTGSPVSGSIGRPSVVARATSSGASARADDEAVDHDLDRVALVLVERGRLREVVLDAVHADADEALLAGTLEDAVALRLAILDERPEHEQPGALGQGQDLVHDLADRLPLDLPSAVRAMGMSHRANRRRR